MKTKNEYGRTKYKDSTNKVMRVGDSFSYIDYELSTEKCDYCIEHGELSAINLVQENDYVFKMLLFNFFKDKYNTLPIGMTFKNGQYKVWVDSKKVKRIKA